MKTKIICYIIDAVILISLIALWGYILAVELPMKSIIALALCSLVLIILGTVVLFVAIKSKDGEKTEDKPEEEKPDDLPDIVGLAVIPEVDETVRGPDTECIFDPLTKCYSKSNESGNDGDETEMIFEPKNNFYIKLQDKSNSVKTYATYFVDEAIIGRKSGECNIVISDEKSVSRRHCRLFVEEGEIMAEDLTTPNGTYVNGVKLEGSSVKLSSGDELKMGRAKFIVTIN